MTLQAYDVGASGYEDNVVISGPAQHTSEYNRTGKPKTVFGAACSAPPSPVGDASPGANVEHPPPGAWSAPPSPVGDASAGAV